MAYIYRTNVKFLYLKLQTNSYRRSWDICCTIAFSFFALVLLKKKKNRTLKFEDLMEFSNFSYLMPVEPDQSASSL